MNLNPPTRAFLPSVAMLLATVASACAQGRQQPVAAPSLSRPAYSGAAGYQMRGPQAYGPAQQGPQSARGNYPASRQGGGNLPPRYGGGSQYGQPRSNGYAQPQQRFGAPGVQGNGYGYAQSEPGAPQTIPNRNANYSGMNQQPLRNNPQQRFWQQQGDSAGPNGTRGEHLQQWMQHHNNLNTQDQQRALEREPGFNQLPQQTQQRMLQRLQRLNSMPPEQRERTLQRSEQMERLSPMERGEVRTAMGQLGSLPQDRRRAVARYFRELRPMSPDQRSQVLNSPEYRQQFNDQERSTLNNLLSVSPMLPQQ